MSRIEGFVDHNKGESGPGGASENWDQKLEKLKKFTENAFTRRDRSKEEAEPAPATAAAPRPVPRRRRSLDPSHKVFVGLPSDPPAPEPAPSPVQAPKRNTISRRISADLSSQRQPTAANARLNSPNLAPRPSGRRRSLEAFPKSAGASPAASLEALPRLVNTTGAAVTGTRVTDGQFTVGERSALLSRPSSASRNAAAIPASVTAANSLMSANHVNTTPPPHTTSTTNFAIASRSTSTPPPTSALLTRAAATSTMPHAARNIGTPPRGSVIAPSARNITTPPLSHTDATGGGSDARPTTRGAPLHSRRHSISTPYAEAARSALSTGTSGHDSGAAPSAAPLRAPTARRKSVSEAEPVSSREQPNAEAYARLVLGTTKHDIDDVDLAPHLRRTTTNTIVIKGDRGQRMSFTHDYVVNLAEQTDLSREGVKAALSLFCTLGDGASTVSVEQFYQHLPWQFHVDSGHLQHVARLFAAVNHSEDESLGVEDFVAAMSILTCEKLDYIEHTPLLYDFLGGGVQGFSSQTLMEVCRSNDEDICMLAPLLQQLVEALTQKPSANYVTLEMFQESKNRLAVLLEVLASFIPTLPPDLLEPQSEPISPNDETRDVDDGVTPPIVFDWDFMLHVWSFFETRVEQATKPVFHKIFKMFEVENDVLVDRLFDLMDDNANGLLSLKELLHGLSLLFRGSLNSRAEFVFRLYDLDDVGHLRREHFQRIVGHMQRMCMDLDAQDELLDRAMAEMEPEPGKGVSSHDFQLAVEEDPSLLTMFFK